MAKCIWSGAIIPVMQEDIDRGNVVCRACHCAIGIRERDYRDTRRGRQYTAVVAQHEEYARGGAVECHASGLLASPTPPRVDAVALRAGTKFYAELPDGTISAERQLVEDIVVKPLALGPIFNVYEALDSVILVDVEDEVR